MKTEIQEKDRTPERVSAVRRSLQDSDNPFTDVDWKKYPSSGMNNNYLKSDINLRLNFDNQGNKICYDMRQHKDTTEQYHHNVYPEIDYSALRMMMEYGNNYNPDYRRRPEDDWAL